ncbi:MAG: glycosyltransferase, partial [Candidatus Electrothrix sp. ATG1]|nr:glycosyltransferase [Candidatus Electrothrix sp. ATG1]
MNIWAVIFFLSLYMIFHAYLGYPLTLLLLQRFGKRSLQRKTITPSATLIITAFNEEKRIKEKLENSLQLDYPSRKLQIIIASDGSTDQTNAIVRSYADQGIELLEVKNRGGKEN